MLASLAAMIRPKRSLSEEEVSRGLRMMIWEAVASTAMFRVASSGLLAAFALALGANNFHIGILAALPFLTQLLQLPVIFLVERVRRRKAITLASWVPAQGMWILVALIPLLVGVPGPTAVALLLGLIGLRGALVAVTNCAWSGWERDLVPQRFLGSFFPVSWVYLPSPR